VGVCPSVWHRQPWPHLRALRRRVSGVDDRLGGYLSTMDAVVLVCLVVAGVLFGVEAVVHRSLAAAGLVAFDLAFLIPVIS
jgi:hypothetical protein